MKIDYGVRNSAISSEEISLKLCQFVIFWINVNHYLSDRGVLSRDSKLNKKGKILKSISYNIN